MTVSTQTLRMREYRKMSFREKMQVNPSAGELKVLMELQRQGLLSKMNPCGTVIAFFASATDPNKYEYAVIQKERFTREVAKVCDGFTIPDFPFLDYRFVGYLDGPAHNRRGIRNHDDMIDQKLRAVGLTPKRFPYKPPLSDVHCKEIVAEILNTLQK